MGMSLNYVTDSIAGQLPPIDPGRPAVVLGGEPAVSWTELRARELRYARALQRAGVRKGDRIGLLLRNCVDYIALYLAIGRVGGIAVRLNWRLTGPELEFALSDSSASLLLFDAEFAPVIESIRDGIAVTVYVSRPSTGAGPDWATPLPVFAAQESDASGFPELNVDDPVSLMYSSGTTGRPKGVLFSHGNALWIGSVQAQRWRIDERTVAQTSGPLFHAGGFEVLLLPALLAHGTAVTFPSGNFTCERFLEVARHNGTTSMLLYPFMLADLLHMDAVETLVPAALRRIVTGGDVVMPWIYDEMERRLPGVELVQSYSLTEGGAVSTSLEFAMARGRESSIGRPQAMTEVKVIRPDGTPTGSGEVGEICVRSGGVSIGYWNLPDATEATFVDGWCHTGDLGSVDEDGFLTIAGRAKDMYRSGGENVYPAEVEMVLTGHRDVADAAVIGVPDPRYVETGAAIVVPAEGRPADAEQLRRWLAERLAKYKVPQHFHFVGDLPRNASGKVLKSVLRTTYGGKRND
ncbi:class I adenylate-forming enzyme family protein [Amycolatopsis rubida]|uniref:Fatty-acyl-CoA synthase n=1 Tax=Amycolatopsis rubida TaxID=112413 RepID=A0A1I5TA50_9PSEU|nr:AMP-binding protein [Amycolatopsis rubida]SFP79929.1 fatty-acyl-CoA synthase [Amycolatopsis rubida]